jgi:hypothetical protein
MPLDQFSSLIELLPHIESVLRGKGERLPRPGYNGLQKVEESTDEKLTEQGGGKKNFEETSEEEN